MTHIFIIEWTHLLNIENRWHICNCSFLLFKICRRYGGQHYNRITFLLFLLCTSLHTRTHKYPVMYIWHAHTDRQTDGWAGFSRHSPLLVEVAPGECLLIQPRSLSAQLRKTKQKKNLWLLHNNLNTENSKPFTPVNKLFLSIICVED
jgi:hypothetical protein